MCSVQAKSKTEQCQCALKYHSSAWKREREVRAIIMWMFSLVLACMSVCIYMYVLVCVCVRQGVHICVTVSMCRRGMGVSCVFVCRRPWMLSRPAGNCSGPCPAQKTARASHLQAKWPYPEDINLHLGQQQHEQQDDETGYPHGHCAWLSVRTGSTRYFLGSSEYFLVSDELIYIKIGLIPV